jgi:hypothetical protein
MQPRAIPDSLFARRRITLPPARVDPVREDGPLPLEAAIHKRWAEGEKTVHSRLAVRFKP